MIDLRDLSISFRERTALHQINLSIHPGESVAIMGANGSGKTTLARCLNGLLLPTSGDVRVEGLTTSRPENLKRIRKLVAMVFQNPENQIVSTTVEREIAFGLENLSLSRPEMLELVEGMLKRFELLDLKQHPPHLLSGGEMQRLALASVLAMSPRYLVLDEPTSLLDHAARHTVFQLLAGYSNKPTDHPTPLLITQYPEEALLCRRLIVLNAGRILLDGSPDVIFRRHAVELQKTGLAVPVEYAISAYVSDMSDGRLSLNPTDLLPIP